MEMDANSKLGSKMIPNDPHEQSENGKKLNKLVDENDLIVVNSRELCTGTITRYRKTINGEEKSVLDYFIVCRQFFNLIIKMTIDEERKYCLTKYSTKTGSKSCKESDHNPLFLEINITWNTLFNDKDERIEVFNFKNGDCFKVFQEITENCGELMECFRGVEDENDDLNEAASKWLKVFNNIIKKCFKKVRVNRVKKNETLDKLFTDREKTKELLAKASLENDDRVYELEENLDEISEKISDICAEKNRDIVKEHVGITDDSIEGFSQLKAWEMKKRLAPKNTLDPPAAKIDKKGNLVTEKELLEKLYIETYVERLQPNDISEGLENLESLKNYLFELRYEIAKEAPIAEWSKDDLDKVLKSLKNNKARDAHGHIFELFKYGGSDLKCSILKMFNLVRRKQIYPDILTPSNITSIFKNKGRKNDLNSDRGVFNVVKLRTILDKLVYQDNYEIIDENMSCSNIGARKNRNIRDHLFVVNGVLNDALYNKREDIDIQIYDISKCFDKMWYEETANDVYEAGVTGDSFVVMANSNQKCEVAVKTPWGSLTDRVCLNRIEMQGTNPAPLKCSVQVDTLGKECLAEGEGLFKYKECTNIPALTFVDDTLAFTTCGTESVKLNAKIQSKFETKRLELGYDKCFQMHVGSKMKNSCPVLKVRDIDMKTASRETYLGDVLTTDCKISQNIQTRCDKGQGIINQTISMLQEISFGYYYFEIAMMFRESMLLNGILCSSEVLYGITSAHIEMLEKCDRLFMRRVFDCPISTPIESYYSETSTIPVRFILIGRRLMYLWTLLQKSEKELARNVFETQKLFPVKNDWVLQIKEDLSICNIELTEVEIGCMKKEKFSKIVKSSIRQLSDDYLLKLIGKHSKSENLQPQEKIQNYLVNENTTVNEKKLLFLLRSRMYPVKNNFQQSYSDMSCSLCSKSEETQQHLLVCEEITKEIELKNIILKRKISYQDIFGTPSKQTEAIKVWKIVDKIWKRKLKNKKAES